MLRGRCGRRLAGVWISIPTLRSDITVLKDSVVWAQASAWEPLTTPSQTSEVPTDLKRELGLFDAVMINAGTMIASAIFIVPATVAAAVHGTAVMTLVWVIGGGRGFLGGPSNCRVRGGPPQGARRGSAPPRGGGEEFAVPVRVWGLGAHPY